jgi:ribosomal-protein-alanine N-acetyltransferase
MSDSNIIDSHIMCTTKRLNLIIPDASYTKKMLAYLLKNKEHFQDSSPRFGKEFYTEETWIKKLTETQQNFADKKGLACIIMKKDQDEIIGNFTFDGIVRGPFQACYLGYRLDQAQIGQGYMSEALQKAIEYLFTEWKLHRIMANYMPTNERSGKLLGKLGFSIEGYAKNYLFLNGTWKDHILTALTNHNIATIEGF